jgi:hypothetical protein
LFLHEGGGRKAAKELKYANYELSVELEELADELAETTEKFGTRYIPSIHDTSSLSLRA